MILFFCHVINFLFSLFVFPEKVYRSAADGASVLPPGPLGEGLLRPPVHRSLQRPTLAGRNQASQKTGQK